MSIPQERSAWSAYMSEPVSITMTRGDWLTTSARLELDAERLSDKSGETTDVDAALALDYEAHELGAIGGYLYKRAMNHRQVEA